ARSTSAAGGRPDRGRAGVPGGTSTAMATNDCTGITPAVVSSGLSGGRFLFMALFPLQQAQRHVGPALVIAVQLQQIGPRLGKRTPLELKRHLYDHLPIPKLQLLYLRRPHQFVAGPEDNVYEERHQPQAPRPAGRTRRTAPGCGDTTGAGSR